MEMETTPSSAGLPSWNSQVSYCLELVFAEYNSHRVSDLDM